MSYIEDAIDSVIDPIGGLIDTFTDNVVTAGLNGVEFLGLGILSGISDALDAMSEVINVILDSIAFILSLINAYSEVLIPATIALQKFELDVRGLEIDIFQVVEPSAIDFSFGIFILINKTVQDIYDQFDLAVFGVVNLANDTIRQVSALTTQALNTISTDLGILKRSSINVLDSVGFTLNKIKNSALTEGGHIITESLISTRNATRQFVMTERTALTIISIAWLVIVVLITLMLALKK